MNEKKIQPFMMPMNSEESQRYNGIRQALMDLPNEMTVPDKNRASMPYGVYYPDPAAMQQSKQGMGQPVPGGITDEGGIRPDGMLPPAVGGDPADMMPKPMPQPMMQSMQMPGAGMNQRGLGKLMAGLAARTRGGF
jgi:hypothetical protein